MGKIMQPLNAVAPILVSWIRSAARQVRIANEHSLVTFDEAMIVHGHCLPITRPEMVVKPLLSAERILSLDGVGNEYSVDATRIGGVKQNRQWRK